MESKYLTEEPSEGGLDAANVIPLVGRLPAPHREPAPTAEEMAEYRRIRPRLLRMLAEWDQLRQAQNGCPIMTQILDGDA